MRTRVALIKLAAIGDVALAARALRDFAMGHEARIEVHWIIDAELAGLARALVGSSVDVVFHPLSSAALFRGSTARKARESAALLLALAAARPEHTILLHRDWRYRALVAPLVRRKLIGVTRERLSELEAYRRAFHDLARRLHIPAAADSPSRPAERALSGRIGVLVGGARSQKVDFSEKRWPRMGELVELLLERTDSKVVLFGGPEDAPAAERILALAGAARHRVENRVGSLTLAEVPESLSGLDSFVSVDSGLAHIAAAVMGAPNQRVVSLFGPTDPRVWSPTPSGGAKVRTLYKARPCSPCYANDGRFLPCRFEGEYFQHCMKDITAEEVLSSLR